MTSRNNTQVQITYDGDGNKVHETVAGVTTSYLTDTKNPTGYAQVLEEIRLGQVVRAYAYGHDLLSQDQIVGAAFVTHFFGYDGHGNVRFLTDQAGAVTDTYDYDAFGILIHQTGSTPNNYLYAGEQNDPALGLYYNRARYLNTGTGRFWTMDTVSGNKYDPVGLHKYLYAAGNPVHGIDPSGKFTLVEVMSSITVGDLLYAAAAGGTAKSVYHLISPTPFISADAVPGFHKQLASLSNGVYYNIPQGYAPWARATTAQLSGLGLQDDLFESGSFRAQLYTANNAYVLAFRGTQDPGDWYTNIAQGLFGPLFTQYDEATALANQVNEAVGGAALTMTGHSLGGGLASAAALKTNRPAVTFNAAGLNVLTGYGGFSYSSSAVNYSVRGEILTTLQRQTIGWGAFGQQYQINPAQQDVGADAISLHYMEAVLRALGIQ